MRPQKAREEPGAMSLAAAIFVSLAFNLAALSDSYAKQPRSHAARAEFQRLHPCPATGERRGRCEGWIIDHVQPLCSAKTPEERAYLDAAWNMQWQTVEEAKIKDREERRMCTKK
jgi:hypothetical protein